MLHILGGGSAKNPADYYGREITGVQQLRDVLLIAFKDGVTIQVADGGQSCCEARYMFCPDDLQTLVGHKLVGLETNSAKTAEWEPPEDNGDEYHDAVFLDVKTDACMVTFSFHVEHNGYYGGFALSVDEV